MEPKGIHFVGMGISGGEEGARHGPSLMPGGPKEAFDEIEPILSKCAAQVLLNFDLHSALLDHNHSSLLMPCSPLPVAQVDDGPCTTYIGPVGSGNYVKMVHNGIEYGDMQLIAETYDILKHAAGLNNEEIAQVSRLSVSAGTNVSRGLLRKQACLHVWESFIVYINQTFADWNTGELESFLIEISAIIMAKRDDLTEDGYLVDKILDKTGMKGTGRSAK